MHVFRSTYSGSFVFSTLKPNSSIMIREWHSKSLIKNTRDHFPVTERGLNYEHQYSKLKILKQHKSMVTQYISSIFG